jgi:thiamine biosynthesis lipoprotein ApbE
MSLAIHEVLTECAQQFAVYDSDLGRIAVFAYRADASRFVASAALLEVAKAVRRQSQGSWDATAWENLKGMAREAIAQEEGGT